MKLYLFTCGKIRFKKGIFTPGAGDDVIVEAPVPFFLIKHPQGNLLFDTGVEPTVYSDPMRYWGGLAKAFWPFMQPGKDVVSQLALVDCRPEDISHIIVSHLHMDHAGGNRLFPKATFIVQQLEIEEAGKTEKEGKGYFRRDWDHPLNYFTINGSYDVFGDGKILLELLPGHTAGQQAAILDLDNSGKVVLASDTVPMLENLYDCVIPRNSPDKKACIQTVNRLKELAMQNYLIVCGHDPGQWEELTRVPYYD